MANQRYRFLPLLQEPVAHRHGRDARPQLFQDRNLGVPQMPRQQLRRLHSAEHGAGLERFDLFTQIGERSRGLLEAPSPARRQLAQIVKKPRAGRDIHGGCVPDQIHAHSPRLFIQSRNSG